MYHQRVVTLDTWARSPQLMPVLMDQVLLYRVAILLLFLVVFAEASLAKIVGREVPEWFVNQFKDTWLGKIAPPPLLFWTIAVLELVVAGLFVAAAVRLEMMPEHPPEFMGYGTIGAMVVFASLCLGQRVSLDFGGAASSFFYATLSGATWYILMATHGG